MHDYLSDWANYDGACYYIDAKHLLEGYTPYKDFILVHPLPFILFLAFFIKYFNFSFLDIFYVIYVLNFIGLIFIYKIGKLLKNEYFGIFLSLVYILDPILLTFGKILFMESLLIPLLLASIYYLLKFYFERKNKYIYLSFFILGIALSIKMTILPMFLAWLVFLFIITQNHDLLSEIYNAYIKNIPNIFLKSLVIYLIVLFFFELMSLVNGREVFIPVITFVDIINFSNYLWMLIFIYIFIILSVCSLINKFRTSKIHTKLLITCFLIGSVPKIIEFVLGYYIGGNYYINQCYIIQSEREGLVPFVIFNILSQLLYGLRFVDWGTIHGWGFIIIIMLYVVIIKLFGQQYSLNSILKLLFTLFILLLLFYNILPSLMAMRYILPVYILFLISFLYWIWDNILKINIKGKYLVFMSFFILLFLNSFICYIDGEKTGFYYDLRENPVAENSIPLYDKFYDYLKLENISNEKFFSTSPVPIAYLNLNTTTKYVDTFAAFFMYKIPPTKLINELKKEGINYAMITYWGWRFGIPNKDIGKAIMLNYTLKYEVGDNIENILLYELKRNYNNYTFYISNNGNIVITNFNDINLNININAKNYELINIKNNTYILKYTTYTNNNKSIFIITHKNKFIIFGNNSTIIVPLKNPIVINGNITYINKKHQFKLKNVSYIVWYNDNKINLSGNINGIIDNSKLMIQNPKNLTFGLG